MQNEVPTQPETREAMHETLARLEQKIDTFTSIAQKCFDELMVERQARIALETSHAVLDTRVTELILSVGAQ